MNKTILFNITAHESIIALNTLIESIFYAYPNSYVVVHANEIWSDFNSSDVKFINEKVFVNKNRYKLSSKYEGIGGFYILNIDYFNSLNLDYDYVVLTASNEMYVKKIDISYIDSIKYGSNCCGKMIGDYDESKFAKIRNQMQEISVRNGMYHGYHEGTFFPKEVANEMVSIYKKYFGDTPTFSNVDEENMLPTILYNIVDWRGTNGLCFNYHGDVNLELVSNFIKTENLQINDNLFYNNFDRRFSIKRIDRFDTNFRNQIIDLIKQ